MKKDLLIIASLLVLIVALLVFNSSTNVFLQNLTPEAISSTQVKIGNLTATAEVAKTPQARAAGLSQKEKLATNSGMLFVFEKEGQYGFWMKNVKFPLDMIWIDSQKRIVDITHSAQPEPGAPDQLLRVYKPADPVRYVLEVSGGVAKSYNLSIGDQVEFSL